MMRRSMYSRPRLARESLTDSIISFLDRALSSVLINRRDFKMQVANLTVRLILVIIFFLPPQHPPPLMRSLIKSRFVPFAFHSMPVEEEEAKNHHRIRLFGRTKYGFCLQIFCSQVNELKESSLDCRMSFVSLAASLEVTPSHHSLTH